MIAEIYFLTISSLEILYSHSNITRYFTPQMLLITATTVIKCFKLMNREDFFLCDMQKKHTKGIASRSVKLLD